MDDLAQREEERRKRREERERLKKAEEDAWEQDRKKREEERKARREMRLKGESVEAEAKPKMTDIIEREEEEKRKALEEEKKKRVEEANSLAEARKKTPAQPAEAPQPAVKKDEPKVEIKPRIEKLEKITKGEEEHQVKPTVDVKLETKDLNIKPTIEYMEKISSPRSNTPDPVSPRNVSPRSNATAAKPAPSPATAPTTTATKEEDSDSDDDSSSYTSSSSVSSDSENEVEDKKKDTQLAAEQEIKKALEEEEKKIKAKEEEEKKKKAEEEEKKKQLALEEERKKKQLALEEEEKKKKLEEEEKKKKQAALEEEEKKKKLEEEEKKKKQTALEEEEKRRKAKEEEEKKRKLEEEKKKAASASTTTTTTAPAPAPVNTTNNEVSNSIIIEEDKEEDFTLYKKLTEKELITLENSYSQRKIAENAKKEPQQTAFYASHLSEFFHSFTSLCRDISSQYDVPELVFIGTKGQGKSNLLASILGVPLSYDSLEKPIYFHLLCDPSVAKYSYSIENPNKAGDYSSYTTVSEFQNKLKEVIKEKGKLTSTNVKISSSLIGFNFTLIDTPYLHLNTTNDKLVLDLIKDQSRTIIYVKEATVEKEHNFLLELKQLLNSVDPKFSRTILVNSKLDNTLKQRLLTNQINDALESSLKFPGNTFWVSALTTEATSAIKTEEEYKERLLEVQKIDIKILESLRYNKKVASIGLSLLRSYLLNLCWNQYKVNIPKMQQKNKDTINKLSVSQRKIQAQLEKLTTDKLRHSINNYYHLFLIQLKKLLEGNEKVQSPMIGQTLVEEYSQNGFSWEVPDSLDSLLNSSQFKEKVPLHSSRLNGAHQFKRLLSEFQLVLEQIHLPNVSVEEIVCAGGGVLQSSNSSLLYAACEFTRSEAFSLLQPLVVQLAERALFILKRQAHVVDTIIRSNESPYLISYLDSLFYSYFEDMRRSFLAKINEEFYSTATLYWNSLLNDKDAHDQEIGQYSNNLFNSIKDHIATKSLLLLTNYFVFSVLENSEALENLQLKLFRLSDQDITELFQVHSTKANLEQEDNDIAEKVKVLESYNQQIATKLVYWPKAS